MQANDARVLKDAAVPTVIVGIVAAVVSGVLAGGKGVIGALSAAVLVIGFFTLSQVVMSKVSRKNPHMLMNVALATYLVKIVVLGVFMGIFKNTTLFNTKAFGLTVLACALVWVGFQVRAFLKLKMLYVEPEPPKARGTASTGEDR